MQAGRPCRRDWPNRVGGCWAIGFRVPGDDAIGAIASTILPALAFICRAPRSVEWQRSRGTRDPTGVAFGCRVPYNAKYPPFLGAPRNSTSPVSLRTLT